MRSYWTEASLVVLLVAAGALAGGCGKSPTSGWRDPSGTYDTYPRWDPVSNRIAYFHGSYSAGDSLPMGLYVTDTLTRARRLVIAGPAANFDWIPGTDSLVVVVSGGLARISATTGDGVLLLASTEAFNCRASASGRYIAFDADHEGRSTIFVYDQYTSSLSVATPDTIVAGHPSWSPNADRLVMVGGSARMGGVLMMTRDGTSIGVLVSSRSEIRGTDWSKDGSKILYTIMHGDGHTWLTVTDTLGTSPTPIAETTVACWSPNGDVVVYSAPTGGDGGAQLMLRWLNNGVSRPLFE